MSGRAGIFLAIFAMPAALVIWSYVDGGIFAALLSSELTSAEKVWQLRSFFHSLGPTAPLAYVLLVTIEVVIAPLPGMMLYAPGGAIFGGFWGGLLSLVGNVAGAALACQLTRLFGQRLCQRMTHQPTLHQLRTRIARHGVAVVFLLRVNPLTSSDLVSYAAGLTPIPLWKLCVGTAAGMAPLCWIQAYAADHLLASFPELLSPLVMLCAIYAAFALTVLWRISQTP